MKSIHSRATLYTIIAVIGIMAFGYAWDQYPGQVYKALSNILLFLIGAGIVGFTYGIFYIILEQNELVDEFEKKNNFPNAPYIPPPPHKSNWESQEDKDIQRFVDYSKNLPKPRKIMVRNKHTGKVDVYMTLLGKDIQKGMEIVEALNFAYSSTPKGMVNEYFLELEY